jgi:hypothetical protein
LTVITSTIGRIPPSAAPTPAELVDEALGHRVRPTIEADVLAHEEHARVALQRFSQRLAHRFAVGNSLHEAHSGEEPQMNTDEHR